MKTYYSVEDICIEIEHEEDLLFKEAHDQINDYKSEEKKQIDGIVKLIPSTIEEIEVPKKAIRSTLDEEGREGFIYDKAAYLLKKESYVIKLSPENKSLEMKYVGDALDAYPVLRGFLKGVFIRAAEDKGYLYMHASAVDYKGKIIVLTGDSHCGKSSFLMRFVKQGGKVISDDCLLIKDKKPVTFTFKSNVDKNFSNRFGVKKELFDNGSYISREKHSEISHIFFLRIWNNEKSEIKEFDYGKSILNLVQRFQIEDLFLRRSKEFLFENYSSMLENVKCYEFFAGNNEEEVNKTMFKFLDGD